MGPKANVHTPSLLIKCESLLLLFCSTCILPRMNGEGIKHVSGRERTPRMGQNARKGQVTASLCVLALSLLCSTVSMLPVARSQTKPGAPSAPTGHRQRH